MTTTAIDPLFVFIPLAALTLAAFAIILWQFFTARVDWTLCVPALSLACSLFVFAGFASEVADSPAEIYIKLSDLPYFQDKAVRGNTGHTSAFAPVHAERQYAQFSPYPQSPFAVRSKATSPPTVSIMTVRDADEPIPSARYALFLLAFCAPALVGTTLLQVAPGHRFDILRRSLYIEQVLAPVGTGSRGSKLPGPHAVLSHLKEKTVRNKATDDQKENYEQRPLSTLSELEVEVAKSKGQLRHLTEAEIAEIKKPLYDRFSTT